MRALFPVLRALCDADVSFVVVGGVAVVLHGHPRTTIDLDVVLDLEPANVRRAVTVLGDLGLRPRLPVDPVGLADPVIRAEWVRDHRLQVFSMHDPVDPRREVDIVAESTLPYGRLRDHAAIVRISGTSIHVASRTDLIEMKLAAGRPQDLADVAALEAMREVEGDD